MLETKSHFEVVNLQSERQFSTRLWSVLILLIGSILYGLSFTNLIIVPTVLKDAGLTLVGGAVVAILFDWISDRNAELRVRVIVEDSLQRALSPVRTRVIADALTNYRWACLLELPAEDDPYPDYLRQHLRLGYTSPSLPDKLLIVCAVSNENFALHQWAQDPRRALLWKIETEGADLDIKDSRVFSIGEVLLEGTNFDPGKPEYVSVPGGLAAVYSINVPAAYRDREGTIDIAIQARMFMPKEGRIITTTQFYRTVQDAEFVYYVSDLIPLKEIHVITNIAALVPGTLHQISGRLWPSSHNVQSARAVLRSPAQTGSSLRFEMYRRKTLPQQQDNHPSQSNRVLQH